MPKKFTFEDYKSFIKDTELDTYEHEEYLINRKITSIDEKQYEGVEEITSPGGVIIPVSKIACSYLTKDYDGSSLYELLTNNKHHGRVDSLNQFFKILQENGVQKCKDWLKSPDCASSDSSQVYGKGGELPNAKYYPDLNKYLINTGKNRAFSAMLIRAEEICFNSITIQRKNLI
ncbi:hypothetical protein ACQ5SI_23915 [Peribacillus frigoritolerans]|uniref:hypothetical protein n=1 Tax=Peribacillus frigoritolerans TaxID=450367 RepID=UPI003D338C80